MILSASEGFAVSSLFCCLDLWKMAVVEGELFSLLYCYTVYNLREFWEGTAIAYSSFFFLQRYFSSFSCSFMGSWSLLLLPDPWRKTLGLSNYQEAYLTYRKDLHTLQRVRNGNPLQYSCLGNPRDKGAWWAAIYGVASSQTWLRWLTSNRVRQRTDTYSKVF